MQYPVQLKMSDGTLKTFWLSDEKLQFGGADNIVNDVQINGTSITQDGVANIPVANDANHGVLKLSSDYNLTITSAGVLRSTTCTAEQYQARNAYSVVSKGTLNNVLATPSLMPTLTSTEQAAARSRLGAEKAKGNYELIETFTLAEASTWERTAEPNGTPYNFTNVIVYKEHPADIDVTGATGYGRVRFHNASDAVINSESSKCTAGNTYAFARFTNDLGVSFVDYVRVATMGSTSPYLSLKSCKGYGWDINFGNCTKISTHYNDKDPAGTIVSIYAIRA